MQESGGISDSTALQRGMRVFLACSVLASVQDFGILTAIVYNIFGHSGSTFL